MSDRKISNPVNVGIVGIVVGLMIVIATLQYDRLPFLRSGITYTADFADAGGLLPGDQVEVAGIKVGKVEKISLDDQKVLTRFTVSEGIQLGDKTTAAIKTNTVLGRKSLTITPAGEGAIDRDDTIPLDRTTSPYSLTDALGDLSNTVHDLDTAQLSNTLNAMSDSLQNTPAPLRSALDGISRLSESINARDESLRQLLNKAKDVTQILADRGGQINALLLDGNQLLGELDRRRASISELISNISSVSQQLSGVVNDNQQQMRPTLDKLNSVVAVLQKNKDNLGKALDGLAPYANTLGEAVASGPYFQAYVSNINGFYTQTLADALVWPQHVPDDLRAMLTQPGPSIKLQDRPK
ncbi:MCE family protein [Antrihabitans cavernicola]|uniref:MCE family protein n=1 Tax=Antrihabitans cavernicola TaxID=2495913 RepID=A0A5A7SAQ8_9NOCA|nr:MCE family protein [Spelaeibacter cavernicola]KAA0021937.1 MCE family protein [Spelaeibacter cavernicola]